MATALPRHPDWIRVRLPAGENYTELKQLMRAERLHTVCEEARCPNLGECWERRTATFMILGDVCTRSCGFCAVKTGKPLELDREEPRRVAVAAARMGLRHAVVTSVNRDELPDGGAFVFAETVHAIREAVPGCTVEVLIPDFRGVWWALDLVLATRPDVLNHNTETVPRLYEQVRPQGRYERSLELLKRARAAGLRTKSGLMLGLGETRDELREVFADLRENGCDVLTLGQYLRPTRDHLAVAEYVAPEVFAELRDEALELGFLHVESGPLVRSSYHADEHCA
jgi:lipoic acid synthetase